MSDTDILAKVIRPDSIEDEDDGDDNDDDLNDNIDNLDCPSPLARPSKGDIEIFHFCHQRVYVGIHLILQF